jgi:hypothetical protein
MSKRKLDIQTNHESSEKSCKEEKHPDGEKSSKKEKTLTINENETWTYYYQASTVSHFDPELQPEIVNTNEEYPKKYETYYSPIGKIIWGEIINKEE